MTFTEFGNVVLFHSFILMVRFLSILVFVFSYILGSAQNDASIYYKNGLTRFKRKDYKLAILEFRRAIEKQPSDSAYFHIGFSEMMLGDTMVSIQDFTKAIALDSDNAMSYFFRGMDRHAIGEYSQAIQDFTKYLTFKPGSASAYFFRAKAKLDINQYLQAISDFDSGLKIDSTYAVAYRDRGKAKFELKDFNAAAEDFITGYILFNSEVVNIETRHNPDENGYKSNVIKLRASVSIELKRILPFVTEDICRRIEGLIK
ncbi:MAG: hypothetical protein JWO06_973 [Bacteroidota bacterium]|nr:hypothetical protein [Bacteroidota bacterium]